MIKLNTLSIENFIKEIKERNIKEVRKAFSEKTEGRGDMPFKSITVKLTSFDLQKDCLIYYEELMGCEVSYFDEQIRGIREKAEKRGEEIEEVLKAKKLIVKDGVYE